MFRRELLPLVMGNLGVPLGGGPTVDAFASPHHALFDVFWSASEDAFAQNWCVVTPLWVKPPFSMDMVLQKLLHDGGHPLSGMVTSCTRYLGPGKFQAYIASHTPLSSSGSLFASPTQVAHMEYVD